MPRKKKVTSEPVPETPTYETVTNTEVEFIPKARYRPRIRKYGSREFSDFSTTHHNFNPLTGTLYQKDFNMSDSPTVVKTTKTSTAENPSVKDAFLADLIDIFGYEKGVKLYQEGKVSKEELSSLVPLLEKFAIDKRILRGR